MTENLEPEYSVRDLRRYLADILNAATAHGTVTYVTSRGRRIAAVVPLSVVEAARKADSE
jgi:prevent-host-death family protein